LATAKSDATINVGPGNPAIQIPWISMPGFVYKFSAGFYFVGAFVAQHLGDKYSAGLNWNFNLGSSCELRLLQNAPVEVGVNIAALAALFLLKRAISASSVNPEEPSPKNDRQDSSNAAVNKVKLFSRFRDCLVRRRPQVPCSPQIGKVPSEGNFGG